MWPTTPEKGEIVFKKSELVQKSPNFGKSMLMDKVEISSYIETENKILER